MSVRHLLKGFFLSLLFVSSVYADAISFTPTGTSTVAQNINLYWDMLSSNTSTSEMGAVGNFYLSDHGDFHYMTASGASMVVISGTEGGDTLPPGTLIGPGSTWATMSYAGTTDYQGVMTPPETAYFGLRFEIAGQVHYGWVQIEEGLTDQSVLAWGYETTPGTAIAAGDGEVRIDAVSTPPVPSLQQWALILLTTMVAAMGLAGIQRRRARVVNR